MIIYIITNDVNDKVYIGQTTKTLENRIMNHRNSMVTGVNTHIYNAMRKYGWEKFHFQQIDSADSQEELDKLEEYYIKKYDSVNNGYNMAFGGSTNTMNSPSVKEKHDSIMRTDDVRERISKSVKNYYKRVGGPTEEHRRKLSESKKALYSSEKGEEVKRKFRESFKLSPEHFRALNDSKNKSVYCVDRSGNVLKEFERVKDAAIWWNINGHPTKNLSSVCDAIKKSFIQDKYIDGIKWIYRV